MELNSFNKNDPMGKHKTITGGDTRNTSEEFILGGEGITKTVETKIDIK